MSKHNYKSGQRVRVKSWEELKEEYGMNQRGNVRNEDRGQYAFLSDRDLYGKEYVVQKVGKHGVFLDNVFFYPWEIELIEEKYMEPQWEQCGECGGMTKDLTDTDLGQGLCAMLDDLEDEPNPPKKQRTWEITTEAKSSDGIHLDSHSIKVDGFAILDADGDLEGSWMNLKQARDLANKLRKGLEKHAKLFNS